MNRVIGLSLIVVLLCGASLWGGAPSLVPGPDKNLREQDITPLFVQGSDPDGDPLSYLWTIESDPTGQAFFRTTDGSDTSQVSGTSSVRVALRQGPSFPAPSFSGMVVGVRVTVSDGQDDVSHLFNLPVAGVNEPPVVVIDDTQMGTRTQPRLTGQGLGLDARQSWDPDGGDVKFLWRIVRIAGGSTCESGLVLFGKETLTPGLPVPAVTARPANPMTITLDYTVEDGLNLQTGSVTGYMASENGCNAPPDVSATASPSVAEFGERVTLTGTVVDPGDSHSYSWVQLDTSGNPTVSLSDPQARITTFVAPSEAAQLRFRFTATDSSNQSGFADVSVEITASGGGPGGGGEGGSGGGGSGEPSPGETVCSDPLNQPAVADVPSLVDAQAGQAVTIRAEGARDPDETQVFVGGVVSSGVSFDWDLINGAGLVDNSHLLGTESDQLTIELPESSTDRTLEVSLLVNDAAGCGTRYAVGVFVQASAAPVGGPEAMLRYRLQDDEILQDAPSAAVDLTSPSVVVLDASGSEVTGSATYQFSLAQSLEGGTAQLEDINQTVRYLIVPSGTSGSATVTLTVRDESDQSSTASISFQFEPHNDPPVARLLYRASAEGPLQEVGESPVEVVSPAEILLDGGTSSDDGPLDFAFVMEDNLSAGGAVLTQAFENQWLLQLQPGTEGTVTVTLTVTDAQGLTDSASVTIMVQDSRPVPVAAITVMASRRPWTPGQPVSEDSVVELDGSSSRLEGEASSEGLLYRWRQTSGVPVALMDADSRTSRFRVPELDTGVESLKFELTVSFEGEVSDPADVQIPVEVAPVYFSQVAFGPYQDQRFQTVLLLINKREEPAEAFVEVFDQDGQPMDLQLEGEPDWNPDLPLEIEAGRSRRLRFSPTDSDRTVVGWARVRSNLRLTGLVLYQLRDQVSDQLKSEVSLYSSPAAGSHRTFFDPAYGLAAALLNPGNQQVSVRLILIDPNNGPENPLASKTVILEPSAQTAFFLDENFFGEFGNGTGPATLLIEAEGGDVAATVLKTAGGVAISSLPLASQ